MSRNLSTFRQFSEKNPAFPEGGLRHLAFHAEHNGFKRAFPKVGRKRLIDDDMFFSIIEEKNKRRG